jgi:hypothetical protein
MPISQTSRLFTLIKSLTKAEKRGFRMFARRNQNADSLLFLQLFDLLEKQNEADEEQIFKKMPFIQKSQFSNLKRHLYAQIMDSLRLIHRQKIPEIQVREFLDYADILYAKGLYLQSLRILQKAKYMAEKQHNDLLHLSVIEFEKIIESRHITRSGVDQSEVLANEALLRSQVLSNSIRLSNLRILLHGMYIKHGHVKSEEEKEKVNLFFRKNLPDTSEKELGVTERIFLYQSYVWYYYILLDFKASYQAALNWVEEFHKDADMLERDPDLYMRGMHYLLTSVYHLGDRDLYNRHLISFEKYRKDNYKKFNTNSQIISFLYVHTGRFNKHFLNHTYKEGIQEIPKTIRRIRKYANKLDVHRIMVFYYKFSWTFLAAGDPSSAVDYLNRIIQMEVENLREDLQGYARLMFLMAHYDLENYHIMDYLVQNTRSYFNKMKDKTRLQLLTLKFFDKICNLPLQDRKPEWEKFGEELKGLSKDPYESKAFIYLDIPAWVVAKLNNRTIAEQYAPTI